MFRPLNDWVLVQRLEVEDKVGSIHLPDAAKTKAQRGKIIAVGKGRRTSRGILIEPEVQPGDVVCFGKFAGEDIHIKAVEHVILKESEILAVLEAK